MSNKFDELAKGLAQSVTRRDALKKFGVGLGAMALACFGLANKAEAGGQHCYKQCMKTCLEEGVFTPTGCQTMCVGACFIP
jgi:hypothetical protein